MESPLSTPATRHTGRQLDRCLFNRLPGWHLSTLRNPPVELRLFTTTGILGGLSTYSTFSQEAVSFLLAGHYGWFVLHVLSHLIGSLALTLLGIYLMHKAFHRPYREMDVPDPEK
jgi:fluoride exporter